MIKSGRSYLKLTAVVAVLAMTIIAGVLLVYSKTNPPVNKFSVQDATTRENNGKRVRAKPGFELVKDGEGVSARRYNKPTESSSDKYHCICTSQSGIACGQPTFDPSDGCWSCGGADCCIFQKWTGR